MSHLFRKVKEVTVVGYKFLGVPNLFFHSGNFYYNDVVAKKVYNNGSLAVLLPSNSKKSIKQLRKQAVKCDITIYEEQLPF